ncbi:MBL fold metallo-hydrolase [Dyadobacter chenwenxiniae]|uniref:MBL fold metallo-hydrolase n=1 Tax=Dyadobacter chenwenxiniae TaxID=2906456 RepID=A0A9X1PI06_9BACT|nr:MBL fold metallo-hydrolase [Dyadobacter chenwenxiniae]MCF0053850.1 MBL fold metallo-hydrolase [Dyadobacter chenwenxiniae]MCF0061163.1 MBL fold metallo-hydrolase [Dyadobacter chenwenxiniae]UON80989.1 MBL fold metallo-hydrolase [Dyadobacter chenwenxiniae]
MDIHMIDTGFFKLDGGAMFGVVPKSLWNRHNPADEKNLCTWAMRCMLIEDSGRLILIDTGLGNKQDQKFFGHYDLHGDASLISSIKNHGYDATDITDVILTHLHFDHVGGAVQYNKDRTQLLPTFPNAVYWSNAAHWEWAVNPNPREKASFLKENILPLKESGQLKFIDKSQSPFSNIDFIHVDGHTEQMMLPVIHYKDQKIIYAADLLPSSYHIPLAWIMSYDMRPLVTMQEKQEVLQNAAAGKHIILFEHDPAFEAAVVEQTEKGIAIRERGALSTFIS